MKTCDSIASSKSVRSNAVASVFDSAFNSLRPFRSGVVFVAVVVALVLMACAMGEVG